MDDVTSKDRIRAELQQRHVKLWKPPYYGIKNACTAISELSTQLTDQLGFPISEEDIHEFRVHALQKLKTKGKLLESLAVKVVGPSEKGDWSLPDTEASLRVGEDLLFNDRTVTIQNPNPELKVSDFLQWFSIVIGRVTSGCQYIHKGKSLGATGDDARLTEYLQFSSTGKATVLCIVRKNQSRFQALETNPDEARISSIRRAAAELQRNGGAAMDITDQAGNHVAISHIEKSVFSTALGLHALGRHRMQESNWSSAILFLVEADVEWNSLSTTWKTRVDNYGQLQLDIAWVYLQLESLENLEDCEQRLEVAERVLRKQVHSNFVTLAIVLAEQNQPVPALAAIFVRLFLLQSIAEFHSGQQNKYSVRRKERLDWAWALARSLRAVSPPESVNRLCQVFQVPPEVAIAALRRTNGSNERAATLISQESSEQAQAKENRRKQNYLGLCENGTDFVNLGLVSQLQTILNENETVASGLLRLFNNDLQRSLDLFQDRNRSEVFRRVDELDQQQGRRKRMHTEDLTPRNVDDVALASLLSMGVAEPNAKQALQRCSNNVEIALLWLTNPNENTQPPDISDEQVRTEAASAASMPLPTTEGQIHENSFSPGAKSHTMFGNPSSVVDIDSRFKAEREAVKLLERVLGEAVAGEDGKKDDYVGNSLDDEWKYIEKYRRL